MAFVTLELKVAGGEMRSERRTRELVKGEKYKGGCCGKPYLNTSTCHGIKYRVDETAGLEQTRSLTIPHTNFY